MTKEDTLGPLVHQVGRQARQPRAIRIVEAHAAVDHARHRDDGNGALLRQHEPETVGKRAAIRFGTATGHRLHRRGRRAARSDHHQEN